MAKKLKKDTTIAKAKSLKTKVIRKFAVGGPVNFELENLIDPEKPTAMQPIGMKPIVDSTPPVELKAQYKQYPYQNPGKTQFFPSHYLANKDAYDKADSQGRTMGIDWYEKRKQLPQFKDASESFIKTFKEGAPAYYFPEEAFDKTKVFKDSVATALMPGYPTQDENVITTPDYQSTSQGRLDAALKDNPNASYRDEGRWGRVRNEKGEKDNLYLNSVNYRGHSGAEPFTTFEELNHIASNTAGGTNTGHKEAMEKLGQIVDENTMLNAGYTDIPDYEGYAKYASGDQEEFFTSLQTARQSLGLDPLKEDYTEDQMLELLEKKRAEGEAGLLNKESAEADQMGRFYRTIGWPTKNSKYLNGKNPSELTGDELEQYNKAKRDAAKRFLQSHNSVAENEGGNTEDYGLPQAARYGGYKYEKGGPGKKKEPAKKSTNQAYPPGYFVTNPRIIYHTDPREFQIASGAEADSAFAHQNTQNLINYLKVNPTVTNGIPSEIHKEFQKNGVNYNPFGTTHNYPINSATGKEIKPTTVGLVWPSKTPGEVYVQSKWNKGTYGPNAGKNFDKNVARDKRNRNSVTGYYTGYYPAPKQHHVLETAGEPMEPIGMKPIESKSAPVKIEKQLPEELYTLHETGNAGGVAYLHKTVRDKNGNIIQSGNMGVVLTEDFLTPEEQKEFDSKAGGTASVQFNPKAKIWHDLQEPLQIIEEKRGTKQKQLSMQQKAQQEIEAEKAAQQQWEIEKRAKEKARIKKAQEEVEAQKGQRALGGFGDPEDPKKPWRHKIKSEDGNYLYNRVGTNAIQDYDKSTVRRTLKGFITGAPKPKETIPRTSNAKFAEGGMNKNMFNANSTTGPRSEHSWQDPGVNRFSGNTNGVNADYYFKKGGLKSKVSSKFAKLKL